MKRQVQITGGRRDYFADDVVELQGEPLKVLDAFFTEYGPCIIQGCEITATTGGKYDIASGLVALMATDKDSVEKITVMPFTGASGISLPAYFASQCTVIDDIYDNGEIKPITYIYTAVVVSGNPDNEVSHLVLTTDGGNRFSDKMQNKVQDATHRFISDAERTKWNKKMDIVPQSLMEQIVPGEFWIGADSVSRQVYQRTFVGGFTKGWSTLFLIADPIYYECYMVNAGFFTATGRFFAPDGFTIANNREGTVGSFLRSMNVCVENNILTLFYPGNSPEFINARYSATVKYTKL